MRQHCNSDSINNCHRLLLLLGINKYNASETLKLFSQTMQRNEKKIGERISIFFRMYA